MSEMTLTFLILAVTIALFLWGRWQPDLVAVGSLLALYLFGVIGLNDAFSGFSNTTVILIASLFIVGEGLSRTGATAFLGGRLIDSARGNALRLLIVSMAATAILSGFISNTGTVATLMPAVVLAAWGLRKLPSAYLIPLAFAANAGGLLTLTGTPPNIVVTDALRAAGFRSFDFFEFSLIGIPLIFIAIIYMATVGHRLLPNRRSGASPPLLNEEMEELAALYSLNGELYRMRVLNSSPLVGSSLRESNLGRRFGISVLQIEPHQETPQVLGQSLPSAVRERMEALTSEQRSLPDPDQTIKYNDVLILRASPAEAQELEIAMHLGVLPVNTAGEELGDLLSQELGIAEVLLTPRSSYIGKIVAEGAIGTTFGVSVLGLRRGDRMLPTTEALKFGDALLVRGTWDAIGTIAGESRNFVVIGQPEELASQVTELTAQSWVAIGVLATMVALMVTGVVPVVIASILAAGAMLLTGCLTTTQAYRAVSWSTVILIAAMIPIAIALETTGGAQLIADWLVDTVGRLGPVPLLAGIFLATLIFSQVISNTAAAVLMAPIALGAAAGLAVSPHPLMMGLAVAASTAFLTPIGTAPNLMVMAPGGYRFSDYAKVGFPLAVLYFAVSLALIPTFWPF